MDMCMMSDLYSALAFAGRSAAPADPAPAGPSPRPMARATAADDGPPSAARREPAAEAGGP